MNTDTIKLAQQLEMMIIFKKEKERTKLNHDRVISI